MDTARSEHTDTAAGTDTDGAVAALVDLVEQLERTSAELASAVERAHEVVALRTDGRSWQEIVSVEERPLIIERVTRALTELGTAGNRVRREQARALMREDLSVTAVSKLFGVTRQRISILVQDDDSPTPRGRPARAAARGSGPAAAPGSRRGPDRATEGGVGMAVGRRSARRGPT